MLARETAGDAGRRAAALEGLRLYQRAARPAPPEPLPAIAGRHGAALRDYGGAGIPVLFIPSLINPPTILDLGERSLLRWLAGEGFRPLLLDWGSDIAARRDHSVAGHVEDIILPMIAALPEPPVLAGYCLGGTMAIAAAALAPVRGLVTLAAPWHFAGYPDAGKADLAALWAAAEAPSRHFGALPMEMLQAAFWSLDPARTIAKFEALAGLSGDDPRLAAFVALEDWANEGAPIPVAAARELFENLMVRDLPGSGAWSAGGKIIDPTALGCPVLTVNSASDRIVPLATAPGIGERLVLPAGHVGMVVGSRARTELWQPLARWLASC